MSGSTVVGPDPQPSAGRIVIVRVPGVPEQSCRYLKPSGGEIAKDLAALGLALPDADEADVLIRQFLLPENSPSLMQVPAMDHVRLAAAFDLSYLETSGTAQ
jgi:hypothetical protein